MRVRAYFVIGRLRARSQITSHCTGGGTFWPALASLVLLSNAEVISAPRKVLRTSPCHCVPLRQVRQVRRGVPHACGARRSAGPSGARPCAASVGHQRGRFASERRASSRCLYIKSLDFKLRKNLWRLEEGSGNGEGTCSGDPSTKASRGLRTTVRPCSICVARSALPHARGQCEEDGSAPGGGQQRELAAADGQLSSSWCW